MTKASILISGNTRYLGCIIDTETIKHLIADNYSALNTEADSRLNEFLENRKNRNKDHEFHMTLVGPMKLNDSVPSMFLVNSLTTEITDLEFLGFGSVKDDENHTIFITCRSKTVQKWAQKYNLDFSNLHITIGFDKKDINNVDKSNSNIVNFLIEEHKSWIGKEVIKKSNKPFKNTEKVNTVKSIGFNPYTNKPAFQLSCDEWVDIQTVKLK